jgi:hypothetical protein
MSTTITYLYYYTGIEWKTFADFNYGDVDDAGAIRVLQSLDEPGYAGDLGFYTTTVSTIDVYKDRLKKAWKVLTGEIII